jgi:NAD(P)H dehydrogenase (quinone)
MTGDEIEVGKILVTGASGFIGKRTLLHLLKRVPADQLVGLVRDPSKAADLAAKGIELRQRDYLDPASLDLAFDGIEKLMLTSTHTFTDRIAAHGNAIDAAVKAGIQHRGLYADLSQAWVDLHHERDHRRGQVHR